MLKRFLGFVAISSVFMACANGILAPERDGGPTHQDAGKGNDGSTTIKDSSAPQKDSSAPIQDGSTCGFTVCGSLCVDTTQDDQNCGQCNNACVTGSSCTNSKCACTDASLTLCTNGCYDTMTDMNNCGTCGKTCTTSQTCTNGTCTTQATGAPPQGNCAHDLCADSTSLVAGCDPSGCVTNVCNVDSYCCTDFWDSLCDQEVATYCPPYSCP